MTNLISLSPELAQSLIKWVTIGSVIFGVLTGLGAGLTFACQSILDAESDKKIALAQKGAAEARLATEKLKNILTYRSVSDEQAKKLGLLITKKPKKIVIYYTGSDVESFFYSQSLFKAFESIGIDCDLFASSSVIYQEKEIFIYSRDPIISQSFSEGLINSNFDADWIPSENKPNFSGVPSLNWRPDNPDSIMMIVSAKAPPAF
ncbi:hypothetical protein MKW11_14860 [Gluconobacter frateurii]|uniref:hypothetical protein n=1 Tax=Gluconobacter frateurii TaxID=38308 RepID=UPI001F060751|nr:hypothetical protein [Gluconobacter frateurii]UMM08447.1 hypothetical protein MKW11_14860 [Gluconobacter frateurii]